MKNIKPIIIPLGQNCMPRTILTRWGIKKRKFFGELTYPFDFAVFGMPEITKTLKTDFNEFFNDFMHLFKKFANCTIFIKTNPSPRTLSSLPRATASPCRTSRICPLSSFFPPRRAAFFIPKGLNLTDAFFCPTVVPHRLPPMRRTTPVPTPYRECHISAGTPNDPVPTVRLRTPHFPACGEYCPSAERLPFFWHRNKSRLAKNVAFCARRCKDFRP